MNRENKIELAKMQSLMERMDGHYSKEQSNRLLEDVLKRNKVIKESLDELDANDRDDVDTNEFFDMISSMKGGAKASIGYISGAKLNVPQIKKLNPETKRMKSFDDYDAFGKQLGETEKVTGVIKFACYLLNWRSPENMRKHYNTNYVDKVNSIRDTYGVAHMSRRKPYTQTADYGNGISIYNGDNEKLKGHSYSQQDIGKLTSKEKDVKYYLIGENGNILREVSMEELKPYFKASSVEGIKAFRDMQKSDEEIAAYAKQIAELNFRYTSFEHSSIVFVITKINGEKKRFFNKNLVSTIKGFNINSEEFINLAKKKYNIENQKVNNDINNEMGLGEFDDEFTDYQDEPDEVD